MPDILYIPNGPKNLASRFPSLDFTKLESYRIELLDDSSTVIASTVLNKVVKQCPDDVYLHFVNYLGTIDSIIFKVINIDKDTKSDNYQVPASNPLVKNLHGINRFNIKSNNFYQISADFQEEEMDWLSEFKDTSFAWIEWVGIQSQSDDYIPIIILDSKINIRKENERYSYTIIIDFTLSHEKLLTRG